jgi:hypothetical protein
MKSGLLEAEGKMALMQNKGRDKAASGRTLRTIWGCGHLLRRGGTWLLGTSSEAGCMPRWQVMDPERPGSTKRGKREELPRLRQKSRIKLKFKGALIRLLAFLPK